MRAQKIEIENRANMGNLYGGSKLSYKNFSVGYVLESWLEADLGKEE
jgi:hypothetical protein